ncbi:right-handed parallel beta-helix repeat-containing protein [Azospirillum argentinense]
MTSTITQDWVQRADALLTALENLVTAAVGKFPDGSAALPGIAFSDETGTGFSRPGTGALSTSIQGVEVARTTAARIALYAAALDQARSESVAAASTVNLGSATGNYVPVTGSASITAFGAAQAGAQRILRFDGASTLVHDPAKIILPGGLNIVTSAGDLALVVSEGGGLWRCVSYFSAREQGVLWVKSFGARCDGVTDDTAALVAAVAASANRTLVIDGPMYLASPQSISVPSTVTLRFEGNGALLWDFGTVGSIGVAYGGRGYTAQPTVTLSSPPSGGTATATIAMLLETVDILSGGSGYTAGDALTVSGGTPVSSAQTVSVSEVDGSGAITRIFVATQRDYTALPTNPVSVTGGTGTGATFTAKWRVVRATVTAAGSGYTTPPTVTLTGGGEDCAAVFVPFGRYPTVSANVDAPVRKAIFSGNYRYVHGAMRAEKFPVTWWGAVADDVTDSTHPFQCAVAQAQAADGGIVYVPSAGTGDYRIKTVVLGNQYYRRACVLEGDAVRDVYYDNTGPRIKLLDGVNNHMLVKGIDSSYTTIRNLTLHGNQAGQVAGAKSSVIFFDDDYGSTYRFCGRLEKLWVQSSAWHGIYIGYHQDMGVASDVIVYYSGGDNWASTSTVTDEGIHGIYCRGYDWQFPNGQLGRNFGDGMRVERGSQHSLSQVVSFGNGGCGVSVDSTTGSFQMANCVLDHNKKHGLKIDGFAATTKNLTEKIVVGNRFSNNSRLAHNTYSDVYASNEPYLSLVGNSFAGSSDNTRPKYCVETAGTTGQIKFQGNLYSNGGDRVSWGTALTNSFDKLFLAGDAGAGLRFDTSYNNLAVEGLIRFASGISFGDETLSAYDIGSWTPILTASTTPGTHTYSVQAGEYVRTGNLVFVSGRLEVSSKDAAINGNIRIGGLPFTSAAAMSSNHDSGVQITFVTGVTPPAGYDRDFFAGIGKGVAYISLKSSGTSGTANINQANIGAPVLQFSGSYRV